MNLRLTIKSLGQPFTKIASVDGAHPLKIDFRQVIMSDAKRFQNKIKLLQQRLETLSQRFSQAPQLAAVLPFLEEINSALTEWTTLHFEHDFRDVVEQLHFGILIVDQHGMIQFMNPAWQQLLPQYDEPNSVFGIPLTSGSSVQEVNIVCANGTIGVAEMQVANVVWQQQPAYLVILEDITQRRQAELECQRLVDELEVERTQLTQRVEERTLELQTTNNELARTAQLKDEFLASMSHELRTPLTAILGLSESLQEQVYGPLNRQQMDRLNTILESGQHLLFLINEILELAKISAGQMTLTIEAVNLEEIIDTTFNWVRPRAHQKKIKMLLNQDFQVETLQADAQRLKQILSNLLNNALKFTPKGGQVGLDIDLDQEHNRVYLTVWDSGIGIAADDLNKIFQPFVQLDGRLARQYEGIGLGLHLAYRLVELQNGSIAVTSQPQQGSRFTVSLPWQAADSTPVTESHSTARAKILIVEDNPASLERLADYLLSKGYDIIVAHDGFEALQQAQKNPPDIILIDIQMAGMDGVEATQQLRAQAQFATTPIIALTVLMMPGNREACLAAGMNEYLTKPIELKKLIKLIEKYLQNP